MKRSTYLRLSLLIPFLVWGICLLLFLIIGGMYQMEAFEFEESPTIFGVVVLLLMFYVFGMIVWIFPYLLLSLILLAWSFLSPARVMLKAFALSPIAMTIFTIAVAVIWPVFTSGVDTLFSNPISIDDGFFSFNLLIAAVSLVWGYICVGIGFGIYKLFQRLGILRDEGNSVTAFRPVS